MRNTKETEIEFVPGVISNVAGWQIGNKLRAAKNFVSDIFDRQYLIPPRSISDVNTIPLAPVGGFQAGFLMGTKEGIVTGVTVTNFHIWRTFDGAVYVGGTASAVGAGEVLPSAMAWWPEIGLFFVSHNDLNRIYTANPATLIRADFTGPNVPTEAVALKNYLGRMFFLTWIPAAGYSQITWTDALLTSIRANNFEIIRDVGRALFITTPSDVSLGASSHLCIGCVDSIWVLDGDPKFNTAVLRRLTDKVGVNSQNLVVETDKGAIALCTDGELYLIPPGASDMIPLGIPIKNKLEGYHQIFVPSVAGSGGGEGFPAILAWNAPFLYIFPGSRLSGTPPHSNNYFILDLEDISNPRWWGPHMSEFSCDISGIDRYQQDGIIVAQRTVFPRLRFMDNTFATRVQSLESGFIYEPGRDVILSRVVLFTKTQAATGAITVTGTNDKGRTVSLTRTPENGAADSDKLVETIFTFEASHLRLRGNYFWLKVTGTAGKTMIPTRSRVEYRIVGRQHE